MVKYLYYFFIYFFIFNLTCILSGGKNKEEKEMTVVSLLFGFAV
jgi:hypothetical protein